MYSDRVFFKGTSLLTPAAYEDWSLDKSLDFLKAQGVKISNDASLQDVKAELARHGDAAATVRPPGL